MTDLEAVRAMLRRANIWFEEHPYPAEHVVITDLDVSFVFDLKGNLKTIGGAA